MALVLPPWKNFWRITLLWLWPAPGRKPPIKQLPSCGNATQTPRLWALPRDLSDTAAVEAAFQQVKEAFGHLDILVNNAGISQRDSLYNYDPADFEKIINLNVNAVFRCTQSAAKIMKEQGGGVILNTSSMVSLYGQPAGCGYPASKFAVNGLTKSLARELGKDNIRVNAVAPGVIRTDMGSPRSRRKWSSALPLPSLWAGWRPEDIANAFLFLASDMASYIIGSGTVGRWGYHQLMEREI